jgi:hypothetical protein
VPIEEDHYESDYMRRGLAREAEGRDLYEAVTGELVHEVGFVRHDTLPIGCSPDGVVGDFEGGLELKAPKFTTHYEYLRKHMLPSEYSPRIVPSLFVTGAPWWDFCSYCPEFDGAGRLFWVRVHRDAVDLAAYELAVRFFLDEVEQVKATLTALSAPELIHA